MAVKMRVPAPLRRLTGGRGELEIDGATVAEVLANLERDHTGICARLLDERGDMRPHVNLYINNEDIRFLDGMHTRVRDADRISIVPAMAGGC